MQHELTHGHSTLQSNTWRVWHCDWVRVERPGKDIYFVLHLAVALCHNSLLLDFTAMHLLIQPAKSIIVINSETKALNMLNE